MKNSLATIPSGNKSLMRDLSENVDIIDMHALDPEQPKIMHDQTTV